MEKGIPILTRLARLILLVSIVMQVGFIGLQWVAYFRQDTLGGILQSGVDLIGLETFFGVTAAFWFRRVFLEQARGKVRGLFGLLVFLIVGGIVDHGDTILSLSSGESVSGMELIWLLVYFISPLLIVLALRSGSKLLAILAALGFIPMALWNLVLIRDVGLVMSSEATGAMYLAETVEDAGIFLGLLGIRKHREV